MALRTLANGALFAETYGEGPPRVLALHGWGRRGSDFSACLQGLPALALDLPGFGASPPPTEAIGAEGYAEVVADALGAFERPPVLVGHSFGARVAVCLAAMNPGRSGPLILAGAPLTRSRPAPPPSFAFRVSRLLEGMGLVSERRMERLRRREGSADYRAASGVMRGVLVRVIGESYQAQLRLIESPVRLIWGETDREVPLLVARWALEVLRSSGTEVELEVIPGVGHHVPTEAPQRLRQAIQSFM